MLASQELKLPKAKLLRRKARPRSRFIITFHRVHFGYGLEACRPYIGEYNHQTHSFEIFTPLGDKVQIRDKVIDNPKMFIFTLRHI